MSERFVIGVVGNPNCGKTTLFNALTGAKQRVGNWPGVTVERKIGHYRFDGAEYEIVDLPGTYALDVTSEDVSLDEKIARDYVHGGEADLIVNIVDASNLERNLYLTTQLLEMRRPAVVALNMMDAARDAGMDIDVDRLSKRLGCPVVPLVASKREGVDALKQALASAVRRRPVSDIHIPYVTALEQAIDDLLPELEPAAKRAGADARWLASRALEGDDLALRLASDAVTPEHLERLRDGLGEDVDILLADGRYGFAHRVSDESVKRRGEVTRSLSDRIDRVLLNRALGIPIFLAAMYLMFMFTINIGGAFIDFFDLFTGTLLVDGLGSLMEGLGSPDWLTVVLADGIGGGIQVVATFIPVIASLYLFLSFLEDSGYMARAAFVMDRAMRAVGLPGKSFVPLIVGFGCNVPAIMATRTLEQPRDRLMTILMAPFMSCGARLPVYALFAAAFFPVAGQNMVFGLYLIGIAAAVLTGLIMKKTLLQGQSMPFVMELPPYHLPSLKGVILRTWERTRGFILRAGMIIVPMVLVLNFLNALGTDGEFGHENTDQSVLSEVGRSIAPAFGPMGLDEENWPATVGIFTGVLAKEAVVGTLDSLYTTMAAQDAREAGGEVADESAFSLWDGLGEAFASIPANLGDALGTWGDPLGLSVGEVGDTGTAAAEQGVTAGTFGAMAERFDGTAGAFAYLLFILLYFPCTAALAAVFRETNLRWTAFVALWTTGLAYLTATVFYQAATFARHPASSAGWIGGLLGAFAVFILILRWWGSRQTRRLSVQAAAVAGGRSA
ncbi:MAG: Fe(2+) transporter permease subunit FeoB [Ectothiorhodospira sp.]